MRDIIASCIAVCAILSTNVSVAQQLESGNYLFQSASTEDDAKRMLGQSAVGVDEKGIAKPGRVIVSVSEQNDEGKVNTSSNEVKITDYPKGKFTIKSSFDRKAGGEVNLGGFGIQAKIKMDHVKSVTVSIDKVNKVASFTKNLDLKKESICKTNSGGKYYSGDFLLSKNQGHNFVTKVYQGSGVIKIALQNTGSAGVDAAFNVDVNAVGGTVKQDSVFFKVEDEWSIVYVENIDKNFCKNLKGRAVAK